MRAEELGLDKPEADLAYGNENVRRALRNTDWFTSEFIIETNSDSSAESPFILGEGPLKDFFQANLNLEEGNELYKKVRNFLTQHMVGPQGHPYPIGNVSFADDEFLTKARNLGADERHEVDRGMVGWQIEGFLKCLVAPESLRREATNRLCRWGEGYEETKRDVLVWAELVKKGVKKYLETENT